MSGIRRNRFAAAAFYDEDYPLGSPLKAKVLERLEALTGDRPQGRVMLLTQLRYFGFHFNPVNFYYCYDQQDVLCWVLAEVRNTPWNERHYMPLTDRMPARWKKRSTFPRLIRWIWSITGALTVPEKRCICISKTIRRRRSSTPRCV
jgi:DUF1365 family protein